MSVLPAAAELSLPSRTVRVAVALVSLAVFGWGAMAWPAAFWPGYLAGAAFWISVSLGCLALGLLHPLTAGRWGWGMARELHAGLSTIVVAMVFLAPLLFTAPWVFPWARSLDELNEHQQQYLAPQWVLIRTVGGWLVWTLLAGWLLRGYRRTARDPSYRLPTRPAAVGLILFWGTVTTAAVDGLMSVDPGWSSSMFGAIQVVGCVVGGLAWVLVTRRRTPVPREEDIQISHDLGNLLFAFNLVWVYLSFSQYLIIWAGDLPHEVQWYAMRQQGGARLVGTTLLILHFIVPFALLLSVDLKRDPRRLAVVAGILLVMRIVDFGWTVFPACDTDWRSAIGLAATVGLLGSVWISVFEFTAARIPAVDPEQMAVVDDVPLSEPMEAAS